MAEPPFKRSRRPDSKQMWDEADRRAAPTRDDHRVERGEDRNRDRDRRYRSRSPRETAIGYDKGARDQERGYRDRDSGRGRDERHGRRDPDRGVDRGRERDHTHERTRGQNILESFRVSSNAGRDVGRDGRDEHTEKIDSTARPRRSKNADERSISPRKQGGYETRHNDGNEDRKAYKASREDNSPERPAAPVSFKVGGITHGQDHDRMDTDEDSTQVSKKKGAKAKKSKAPPIDEDEEIVVEDDGMATMQALMGFGGFGTTHQKKVEGNNVSAVRKEKKTEYRQYMNRQGGFNRPLSPTRDG